MTTNSDDLILPPSIDPETRKIGMRHVGGRDAAGTRTDVTVRDVPVVVTDEPDTMGGTSTAPSPLETVEPRITFHTDEPGDMVEKLKANVENRRPVMNLPRDAGVELDGGRRTVSA